MYKERIARLMEAVKDNPDDLEFVESRMNTFTDYVSYVAWMETRIQRIEIMGLKGEDYRNAVEPLDRQRRSKHNVAMDAMNQLNRLSSAMGLEPFYEGQVSHECRTQVGDAIGNIVDEYFKGRHAGQLKVGDLMEDDRFSQAVESISASESGMER